MDHESLATLVMDHICSTKPVRPFIFIKCYNSIIKPLSLSTVVRFWIHQRNYYYLSQSHMIVILNHWFTNLSNLYAFQVYFRTFVVIIFRLLPAIFLGDGIYGDEQDEFECVGTQPGCRNMCFTEFSPMQPPRMWCLQILLSCVPPVIFNFYAARQTAQEKIWIKQLQALYSSCLQIEFWKS